MAVGLMTSLPANLGADAVHRLEDRDVVADVRATARSPSPPIRPEVRSERMSPFMLVVTMTSNCSGRITSWCAQLSTMMCSRLDVGVVGRDLLEGALEQCPR